MLTLFAFEVAGGDDSLAKRQDTASVDAIVETGLAQRQWNARALLALQARYSPSSSELPLSGFAEEVSGVTKLNVRIDTKAFIEEGIDNNLPINLGRKKEMNVVDALRRALRPHQLEWLLSDGDLVITTPQAAREHEDIRVYPVGRLLRLAEAREKLIVANSPPPEVDLDQLGFRPQALDNPLATLVRDSTNLVWLGLHDNGGTVVQSGSNLIVRQTQSGHMVVAALLQTLEATLAQPLGATPVICFPSEELAKRASHVQSFLSETLKVNFTESPLQDIVEYWCEELNIEFRIDVDALNEEGITIDTTITESTVGPAEVVLRRVLEPLGLVAINDGDCVVITTIARAQEGLVAVIYDLSPLLERGLDSQTIIGVIEEETSGPWSGSNGGLRAEFSGGILAIQQTIGVHREVAQILFDLAAAPPDTSKQEDRRSNERSLRFYKARSKAEATVLVRLIEELVAPKSWDSSGGQGRVRTAEDRLIIHQTKAIHEQIDQFLREYQQAKPVGTVEAQK